MTKFEEIIDQEEKEDKAGFKGMVSKISKILAEKEEQYQSLKEVWQKDLEEEINIEEWKNIWKNGKMSIRIKKYFKVIRRWFVIPVN